ncbi:MAG: hypothetical protein H9893_07930 [Candidatus Niameybacter stercoravium]|nr:hypothetical protein [Candidatus Niameybacter stercoravium]
MKRILFILIGFLLLLGGLVVEGGFIGGIMWLLFNPWVLLGVLVFVFSCIIGDRIYRYGFRETVNIYEDEDKNVSL